MGCSACGQKYTFNQGVQSHSEQSNASSVPPGQLVPGRWVVTSPSAPPPSPAGQGPGFPEEQLVTPQIQKPNE